MRIIGGKNKGKKLKSFDGQDIRPTSDRARESLFNILGSRVFGCDFLDLCSGTGGVGLESYSRGANSVTFVDSSLKSLNLAKENANSISWATNPYNMCTMPTFPKLTPATLYLTQITPMTLVPLLFLKHKLITILGP